MDQAEQHCDAQASRFRGKALRASVPRTAHADWGVVYDREAPLDLLAEQASQRLAYLIPERHLRMSASSFAFFRGNALGMAADLADTPCTGLRVQACGDAHIGNFGAFASPDRKLVFDINDFDETSPGPWEWDVKRLAASIEICGRDRDFKPERRRRAVMAAVESYRRAMISFAQMGFLDVWYQRLDVDEVLSQVLSKAGRKARRRTTEQVAKAYRKTSSRAFDRFVCAGDGGSSIAFDPPFVVPLERFMLAFDADRLRASLGELFSGYRKNLSPELRHLLEQYVYLDAAQKVVGVGSVGTRTWIVVLIGIEHGDPLVLQIKEAQPSVLERFVGVGGGSSAGERVVNGQRLMQTSSDILLGRTRAKDENGTVRDYYVRQLWDWKTSTDLETASIDEIEICGCLCGWTLARAHARSGDRCAIAGYMGSSDTFDRAIASFASAYADQNDADYVVFLDALSAGGFDRIPAAVDAAS